MGGSGGIARQCNKRIAVTSSSVAYAEVRGMKAKRMGGNTDKYVDGNVKKTELNIQGCQNIVITQVPGSVLEVVNITEYRIPVWCITRIHRS